MPHIVQIAVDPMTPAERSALEALVGPCTVTRIPAWSSVPVGAPIARYDRLVAAVLAVAGDADLVELPYSPGVLGPVLAANEAGLGGRLIVRTPDGFMRPTGVQVVVAPLGQEDQPVFDGLKKIFGGKGDQRIEVSPEAVTQYVTALERVADLANELVRVRATNPHASVVNEVATRCSAALVELSRIYKDNPGVGDVAKWSKLLGVQDYTGEEPAASNDDAFQGWDGQ